MIHEQPYSVGMDLPGGGNWPAGHLQVEVDKGGNSYVVVECQTSRVLTRVVVDITPDELDELAGMIEAAKGTARRILRDKEQAA